MKPKKKPKFNETRAWEEGWGLFTVDEGGLAIQKLDEPYSVRPANCECGPIGGIVGDVVCEACRKAGFHHEPPANSPFTSDDEALWHVMQRARQGSLYHRQAIALAAGIEKEKQ